MFKLGGYRPITELEEVECSKFSVQADKFTKLAATQNDLYMIPEYTPTSNQLNVGSCVGNSVCDALEILKGLEDPNKVEQVSRLFVYYNARNYTGETSKDNGCYITHALDSLKRLGVCREATWEYDTNNVLTKPTIQAYREANDNTISDYYQITSLGAGRIKDIETAIRANHPVVFGIQVGDEFLDYRGENKVFDPPANSVGGHAMILVGVRTNSEGEKEFRTRNSWGRGWGDNGYAWLSTKYVNTILHGDIFVPTRMVDFVV